MTGSQRRSQLHEQLHRNQWKSRFGPVILERWLVVRGHQSCMWTTLCVFYWERQALVDGLILTSSSPWTFPGSKRSCRNRKGKTESGAASPPRGWQLCFSHSPVPKSLPPTSTGNNNSPYFTMAVVIMQHNLSIWLIQIFLNHSLGGVRSVYEQNGHAGTGPRMWAGWELFSQSSRRTLEQNVYCRWKCWSITHRVELRFSGGQ